MSKKQKIIFLTLSAVAVLIALVALIDYFNASDTELIERRIENVEFAFTWHQEKMMLDQITDDFTLLSGTRQYDREHFERMLGRYIDMASDVEHEAMPLELKDDSAVAAMHFTVAFNSSSLDMYDMDLTIPVRADIHLKKTGDKEWLINKIHIIKVRNHNPPALH